MAYSNINKMTLKSTEIYDTYGKNITLATTTKGRSYLANEDGSIIGAGFTSEALALKKLAKIEIRRMNGNLHGLRFGSKITEDTINAYNKEIWGSEFKLTNIRFKKGHYWMADITNTESKESINELRLDYFINYMRIPAGLETETTIMMAIANGARFEA